MPRVHYGRYNGESAPKSEKKRPFNNYLAGVATDKEIYGKRRKPENGMRNQFLEKYYKTDYKTAKNELDKKFKGAFSDKVCREWIEKDRDNGNDAR